MRAVIAIFNCICAAIGLSGGSVAVDPLFIAALDVQLEFDNIIYGEDWGSEKNAFKLRLLSVLSWWFCCY